jgi:uroporphyrinogen-III synthase
MNASPPDTSRLAGKTILVTRSPEQAEPFVLAIEREGGTAVVFPTIAIWPPASWEACDKAIGALYMYDGLIFTSVNSVDYFFERFRTLKNSPAEFESKRIFAVGEKTRERLTANGVRVDLVPEKFSAAELARQLDQEDLRGRTYLFPCGSLTKTFLSENLKSLGASVDQVIVYTTVPAKKTDIEDLHRMFTAEQIDVMTFFSPSSFNNFVSLMSKERVREYIRASLVAAIGPTTTAAIKDLGFAVDIVPAQPTSDSLLEAIIHYLEQNA